VEGKQRQSPSRLGGHIRNNKNKGWPLVTSDTTLLEAKKKKGKHKKEKKRNKMGGITKTLADFNFNFTSQSSAQRAPHL
jgi:predicted secreted acid phosphatase